MSFNTGEDEPHAYANYVDGDKESVPLSFIRKFPADWRTKGWDHNYLYKVFWSPEDGDSPSKLLKSVVEIPLYEPGNAMEKPGYYRAAIVMVKDTLEELEDCIDSKRLSVGVMKYKYTSFDRQTDDSNNTKGKKKVIKGVKAKNKNASKGSPGKRKRKGLNMSAQLENTAELQNFLTAKFGDSVPKSNSVDIQARKANNDLVKCLSDRGPPVPTTEGSPEIDEGGDESESVASTVFIGDNNDVTEGNNSSTGSGTEAKPAVCGSSGLPPVFLKEKTPHNTPESVRPKRSSVKRKQADSDSSSSISSASDGNGKRIKLDADFTPRKYVMLKEEMLMHQSTIKRITNLNFKLQEDKVQLEEKILKLESQLSELSKKPSSNTALIQYGQKPQPNFIHTVDVARKLNFTSCERPPMKESAEFNQEGIEPSSICEVSLGEKSDNDFDSILVKTEPANEDLDDKFESNPSFNTETVVKGIVDLKSETPKAEVVEAETASKDSKDQKTGDNFLDKCPENIKAAIYSIPQGAKRDLRFIKDLSTAAFGPEVLAASSICGTLKGGRKKADGAPKVKKQALCKKTLKFITDELIKRVEAEEKIKIEEGDGENHDRTKRKRIHEAIFDKQKKLRGKGYGDGKKPNTVIPDILEKPL